MNLTAKSSSCTSRPGTESDRRVGYDALAALRALACGLVLAVSCGPIGAESIVEASAGDLQPLALDGEIEQIKAEVLDLNRELFLLEEELLFPANTQVAVYMSMDTGNFFGLDSVQLSINDNEVAKYLYTEREVDALYRGGVHRLYMGNLKAGDHELVAVFTGVGPHGRDYRRATSVEFTKGLGARFMELTIRDSGASLQPEFQVRLWE